MSWFDDIGHVRGHLNSWISIYMQYNLLKWTSISLRSLIHVLPYPRNTRKQMSNEIINDFTVCQNVLNLNYNTTNAQVHLRLKISSHHKYQS